MLRSITLTNVTMTSWGSVVFLFPAYEKEVRFEKQWERIIKSTRVDMTC